MTKRDFELIAKAFASFPCQSDGERLAREGLAYALSNAFIDTNPRFDQVRFLTACGVIT